MALTLHNLPYTNIQPRLGGVFISMKTFICIASGPSLTGEDCNIASESGATVIAVNNSWILCPTLNHIYAGDHTWWQHNHKIVVTTAQKWCGLPSTAKMYGLHVFESPLNGAYNSGQRAILLAKHLGAQKIILIGYDCAITNKTHWHGDHMNTRNPDQQDTKRWHEEFHRVRQVVPESMIVNCSRYTELTAFRTGRLEDEL